VDLEKMIMKLFDPTRKEYYRTRKQNFLYTVLEFAAMAPAAILIYAGLTNQLNPTPFVAGLFGGSFCMATAMIGMVLNQKLVVARSGIEYHVGLSRIRARWKDVEKIASRWDLFPRTEGLIVPKTGELPLLLSKLFIPLSLFAENWRESELGLEIRKHAPHLFEHRQD
jgi:hypothetical protein